MTPVQIVAVFLRLLVIAWVLYMLGQGYVVFSFFTLETWPPSNRVIVVGTILLQLAICVVLWFFPVTIANKLLPAYSKPPDPQTPPRMLDWQALAAACLGLWIVSRAVPDLFYWLTFVSMSSGGGLDGAGMDPENKASVATTVVELVIGLWLILGAKRIAALLLRARTAGVAKQ